MCRRLADLSAGHTIFAITGSVRCWTGLTQFRRLRQTWAGANVRIKVEHSFRVIKQQYGFIKVRYRGPAKNTAQIVTLFALSNLWMAQRCLIGAQE